MDKERSEDLNPTNEDMEERIRQMLDPNIPDTPGQDSPKSPVAQKIGIQSVSDPAEDSERTAPLLQTAKPGKKVAVIHDDGLAPSQKKSKKVIIPIDQQGETKAEKPKTAGAKKITIAEHSTNPDDVAQALNASIAELDPGKDESLAEDSPETAPTAPELDGSKSIGELEEAQKSGPKSEGVVETVDSPGDSTEAPLEEPAVINDPETDKAVAEIVAAEGDEILEIEDAKRSQEPLKPVKPPKTKVKKDRSGLKKFVRKSILLLIIIGIIAVAIIPSSRYMALNTAGVHATSSMTVVDERTDQPLKNAQVTIGNITATTDDAGTVRLSELRLGKNLMTVQKSAFAPVTKYVTIGWGSNPLGRIGLSLTGTQYSFSVTDFLSGKSLAAVTASTPEADAVSDDKGVIKLSLAKPGDKPIKVTLKASGYRTEEVTIQPTDKDDHPVKMVPARKHAYVSKRSGKADVYSSYIDGRDAKVVLAGSGKERDDMVLIPHPTDTIIAYVSTRAGQTNKNGETLNNLLILNLEDNNSTNVLAAEQVRILGWTGDRLVYVHTTVDAKADSADRYRLISYNYKDASTKELAKTNFFNDVIMIGNTVYFALSSAYQGGTAGLYRVNADGTNTENVYNQEVWNVFRTAYDHLTLSVQQEWFDLVVGNKQPTKLNAAPAEQLSRVYVDSPDGKRSLRIDIRDGKGVLLAYDISTKLEKEIQSLAGLTYPTRWINDNTVVYRIKTTAETADYAVSLDGGAPVRISDVTNSGGLNRWLY